MVDEVEDPVAPSARELGIGITPSKESGRTAKMFTDTAAREVALNLEILEQFAEREAATSVTFAVMPDELDRVASSSKKTILPTNRRHSRQSIIVSESGFSARQLQVADISSQDHLNVEVKPVDVDADPRTLRYKQAESILTEVLHYKGLQAYRNKITPEFIAVFNQAEQTFLRELVDVMDDYLSAQERYVTELLYLLDYDSIEALFKDLAAIEEIKEAIATSTEPDLFSKLIKIMGPKRGAIVGFLAKKLQDEEPIDARLGIDKKVARFLQIAEPSVANDLPLQLFAFARVFDKISTHYSASTLEQEANRHAQFVQEQGTGAGTHTLSSLIVKMVTNERVLMFNDMAKLVDDEWLLESGDTISDCITRIRAAVATNAAKINAAMGDALTLAVELPDNGIEPKPEYSPGIENLEDLELEDEDAIILDDRIKISPATKPKLERSLSEPQLRKTQSEPQRVKTQSESRMKKASSLKRLSGLLDATKIAERVKSTVEIFKNRFFNKPDIYAKVSFFDYAHSALHTVQVYQQVSEELGTVADPRVVGWHFTYNSVDEDGAAIKFVDKMPERFQDGDTAELYHNEALVCTIVPQKLEKDGKDEASGVGVTVHRHDEDDMDLAVDIMMASLDHKKEICISVDSSNATPESEKLILAYARVILRHGAIPIVVDGEKTLDRRESRQRLQAIEQQYPEGKKNSTPIAETYKAQVDNIRLARKEEKRVRNADRTYLEAFDIAMQQSQGPLSAEQALKEINKLMEIALRGNLSEGDFAKKVILCVQNTFSITPLQSSREKMHEIEERFLLKWRRCLADYKNASKSQRKMYGDKNDKYEYMMSLGTGFFRLIQIEIENLAKLDDRNEGVLLFEESDEEDKDLSSDVSGAILTENSGLSTADVAFSEQEPDNTDDELDDSPFSEDLSDESQMSLDEFDLPDAAVVTNAQKKVPAKETATDGVNNPQDSVLGLKATVPSAIKAPEPAVITPVNMPESNKTPTIPAAPAQKPAFLAGIETFTRKAALKPVTQQASPENPRAAMLSQIKTGRDGLKPISETALPSKRNTDNLQGTLFQNAASLIMARRQAIEDKPDDTDDDDDWDTVADTGSPTKSTDKDTVFVQSLDAILQQRKLVAAINQPIIMRDPATGKELDELAILTRLATMALIDKTITEDAFLERIITFAFVSPKLASNMPLTPQKTEELKKELRSKFQGKNIDPQHIDELVSKLVKIARHEHSKGHTADEITGQHRDLYTSAKTATTPSHHDDDGEGETRAPAMSTH